MFNALAHSLLSFTGLGSSHSGGAAEEVEESEIDGCPSEDDVAAVRKDLLNFLPLELVDVILDTAEYWPRVSTLQEVPIVVVNNQACCYLITDPMPGPSHPDESGEFQQHRSIREVRFKIRSRDQGWGGEPEHQGTYNGSWSWFEAVILRPSPKLDNSSWYNTALSKPTILRPNEYKMLCSSERDDHPQHWYIQCNVTADENWREHVITWKTEGDSVVGTYDQFKGRVNRGHELVRSLEPGDRLAVIARAMFPGWANHVASVSVEIFYFFW